MIRRQIGWFATAGLAGFVVDAGILFLALASGLGPYAGRVLSILAAIAVTWLINRRQTFATRSDEPWWREAIRYGAAMALGTTINFAAYFAIQRNVDTAGPHAAWLPYFALTVGVGCGMVCNFAMAKFWVFRRRNSAPAAPQRLSRRLQARAVEALCSPKAARNSALLALPLMGLWSLWLGQDVNWDLLNYHLYNPYALLNGRVGLDLAPAQFQSYFNPVLDLPYYAMSMSWPAPAAGFALGAFHGINFILLLSIARQVLGTAGGRSNASAILLALAGCLGPAFLSEIGNTMGDNSTAPFVLAALALLLRQWPQPTGNRSKELLLVLAAGLLAGTATGLKLTNAVYAVALCLALLTVAAPTSRRLWLSFVFGAGVLAGLAATAGYWFLTLWQTFGNPLFPQFNAWFGAPLAAKISVLDTRWLPTSAWEALLFPFVFVLKAQRVGEVAMRPLIWPVLWILMACWAGAALLRKPSAWPSPAARFVVVFVGLAFLTWMTVFSIYRYAVPMELLAPLAAWLLAHRLWGKAPREITRKAMAAVLVLVAATAILGFPSWGRTSWHEQAFRVEVPLLPASGALLLIGSEPLGWMAPFFPAGLAVAGAATNFPETPVFQAHLRNMVAQHEGRAYGVLPAFLDRNALRVARLNSWLVPLALPASSSACRAATALLARSRVRAKVDEGALQCRLAVLPEDVAEPAAANRKLAIQANESIVRYGVLLDFAGCKPYNAFVGANPRPYQLCPVAGEKTAANPPR